MDSKQDITRNKGPSSDIDLLYMLYIYLTLFCFNFDNIILYHDKQYGEKNWYIANPKLEEVLSYVVTLSKYCRSKTTVHTINGNEPTNTSQIAVTVFKVH